MMNKVLRLVLLLSFGLLALSGCTTAKLEARLEANPQCKDVINPKTGALMPCPGTDRAFYRSVGLEPTKPSAPSPTKAESNPGSSLGVAGTMTDVSSADQQKASQASNPQNAVRPINDCKPTIHNKTGGLMPCLPPD
jgi:hypothetical protein